MFGNQSTQIHATQVGYSATANAPKEIGMLQRVEGVRGGLDEIYARLTALSERLEGGPSSQPNPTPCPCGLPGNISAAEERIRATLVLLGHLESAF